MWSSFSRAGLAVDAAASGARGVGQGGLLSVSPKASCGRTALSGSSRQQVSGSVDRAGKTAAKWRAVRTAKPCGPFRQLFLRSVESGGSD